MRRMLEELYFGNLNPNDRSYIRDSGYGKAVRTISENEEKLTELLEGKEKKLLLTWSMPKVWWTAQRRWRALFRASAWERELQSRL